MHRVSTDVGWWNAPLEPLRPDRSVDALAVSPRQPLTADRLTEALFEHVARLQTPEAARAYLVDSDVRRAVTELSNARRAHPALARWLRERPGPAFMLSLLAPFWIRGLDGWTPPDGADVDAMGRALVERLLGEPSATPG